MRYFKNCHFDGMLILVPVWVGLTFHSWEEQTGSEHLWLFISSLASLTVPRNVRDFPTLWKYNLYNQREWELTRHVNTGFTLWKEQENSNTGKRFISTELSPATIEAWKLENFIKSPLSVMTSLKKSEDAKAISFVYCLLKSFMVTIKRPKNFVKI